MKSPLALPLGNYSCCSKAAIIDSGKIEDPSRHYNSKSSNIFSIYLERKSNPRTQKETQELTLSPSLSCFHCLCYFIVKTSKIASHCYHITIYTFEMTHSEPNNSKCAIDVFMSRENSSMTKRLFSNNQRKLFANIGIKC